MKKLIAILLLTAALAFTQEPRRPGPRDAASVPNVPTVEYSWLAPDCAGIDQVLNQISSGCLFDKLKVVAHSSNPQISGFYIFVSYSVGGWNSYTSQTVLSRDSDGNFSATFQIGYPPNIVIKSVSATELVTAGTAYAN